MKTIINTNTAGRIVINSTFKGDKPWFNSGVPTNYNNHAITVFHSGKRFSFDFWGSQMNPEISSDEENIFAFYCFLSDSVSGEMSFEDFCNEFGYDSDSRSAEKTHKLCAKSMKKYNRVFPECPYELINELSDTYNC